MIRQLSRDLSFWAALLAGPLTWGLLACYQGTAPDSFRPQWSFQSGLLAVLVYPVVEEMAFRGFLQGWLCEHFEGRRRIDPLSLANLLTSVIFTAFHLIYHAPLWALAVMPPSLVLGFFRDKYQRLTPSIVLHIFYNAGWLVTLD